MTRALVGLCVLACALSVAGGAHAGAFISATESNPHRITHPTGYTGSGGTVTVDVCIDSTSANASDMVLSVQNAITTYNNLTVHRSNSVFSGNVPFGAIDFESVMLHEMGHCIGLAHSNLASESGVAVADQDYTKSANGSPNVYDLDAGADGKRASGDDLRGNDINFVWYEDDENNPFFITASVVDSTTYSRDLENLPDGDTFAASADRNNGSVFGANFTEAVMNQGTFPSEEQRLLSADDVSALRYARSGLDSLDGTSDDYTVVLDYAGSSPNPNCDINIDFDNGQTSFAVCQVTTARIGPPSSDDYRIINADIFMNTSFIWYFNDETCGNGMFEGAEACDDGNLVAGDGCSQTCSVESNFSCMGFPSVCMPICGNGLVQSGEGCDDGGTTPGDGCDASCEVETGWMCSGAPSVCSEVCGDGLVSGSEGCDDSGTTPGDGCDTSCQVESGWLCSGEPSSCGEVCGDGLVSGSEGCDDSGTTPGDGCDASCQVESGWMCSGEPSSCGEVCGNGIITLSEGCDDSGTTPGDGCDASCQVESGWMCSGEPSSCGEVCGDGIITLTEGCDDSGTTPGDGCDASCQVEPGWICTGEPSVCTPVSVGALDTPARVLLALGLMGLGGFWLAARGVPGRRAV